MKKNLYKYLVIFFCIFIIKPYTVFAKEAKITVIDPYDISTEYEEGDCTLIESNGEYLLVDTCKGNGALNYLKAKKITNFSILISHYHSDHILGLINLIDPNQTSYSFQIKKIYLPDPKHLAITNPPYTSQIKNYYGKIIQYAEDNNIEYEHLWSENYEYTGNYNNKESVINVKNHFTLGDIEVSVLGPIIDENACQENCEIVSGEVYFNNSSLVTMFKIGNIKYLSAGDIESRERRIDSTHNSAYESPTVSFEEDNLISKKCNELEADIFKLNHHGLVSTSNDIDFLNCVKPKYIYFNRSGGTSNANVPLDNAIEVFKTEDVFKKANIYNTIENGSFSFVINDNNISVEQENIENSEYEYFNKFNSRNLETITVNYLDDAGNKIADSKLYNFSTATFNNYHLFDYIKDIDGYTLNINKTGKIEEDNIITEESTKIINLHYDKIKPAENTVDNTQNTQDENQSNISNPETGDILIKLIIIISFAIGLIIYIQIKNKTRINNQI